MAAKQVSLKAPTPEKKAPVDRPKLELEVDPANIMLAQTKSKQLDLDSLSQVGIEEGMDTKPIEANSSQPTQALSSTITNNNDNTTANSSQSVQPTANSA